MHQHYYQTTSQVISDTIIDEMFAKLDSDGGGTLDMGEITALLVANGVHMSIEQVANMFAEALRMDKLEHYKKQIFNLSGNVYSES